MYPKITGVRLVIVEWEMINVQCLTSGLEDGSLGSTDIEYCKPAIRTKIIIFLAKRVANTLTALDRSRSLKYSSQWWIGSSPPFFSSKALVIWQAVIIKRRLGLQYREVGHRLGSGTHECAR